MVLTVSIDALIARNGNCCFQINAAGAGGAEGSVGQLPDGQNRVGGGLTPATYCIDSNGAITDERCVIYVLWVQYLKEYRINTVAVVAVAF